MNTYISFQSVRMLFTSEDLDLFNKLWRKRCFTSNTTINIDDLVRGFPPDTNMKERVDKLIKQGVLVKKPHKRGLKVYINPNYRNDIYKALKQSKEFPYFK